MAKTLDFNIVDKPTLPIVMRDEARTAISVGTPTEGLIEELQSALPKLQEIQGTNSKEQLTFAYDLAARLINCNYSGVAVTAEELRGKYKLDYAYLFIFYKAYLDFIAELTNAKN